MSMLIEMKNVSKFFPGVKALNDVDFDVKEGEVHALVGENGAGKSTLIKIIAGVYDYTGEYNYEGRPVNFISPSEAIDQGIRVIYQELNLCETVSVAENIYMGRLPVKAKGLLVDKKKLYDQSREFLDDIGLDIDSKISLEHLPTSKKQMVEIAKAVSANAKLVVMDEPTSSLGNREIEKLFIIIEQLKKRNVGVVYVSHKLDEIFNISDRVTVLRDGQLIATKTIKEVKKEQLISMMVGREFTSLYSRKPNEAGKVVLHIEGISSPKLKDVSFEVREGEIIGFSGLIGAGRTELAKAIFGFDPRDGGKVTVDRKEITPYKTHVAKQMGIGYVPEDRKKEGLLPNMSVKQNITISILDKITKGLFLNKETENNKVKDMVERIRIKTPSLSVSPAKLSGGNQQKVIVARWLIAEGVKALIVDEPTRGIDVGAKTEIYSILDTLAKTGMAIIIMSSELNEVLDVCDRIYVMNSGRITGMFTKEEATSELIMTNLIG